MIAKWLRLLIVPLFAVAFLAGCAKVHGGSGPAEASSASAQAHAVATSSAGVVGKEIVKKCVPQNGLAEARWFEYMAATKHGKHAQQGIQTREAFASCAGIPPSKMSAFENDALTAATAAAKSALKPNVTLRQATKTYLETTLPTLVVKYRG